MSETGHTLSEDCPCGPTVIPVPRDDGTVGWTYAHHESGQTAAQQVDRATAVWQAIDETSGERS